MSILSWAPRAALVAALLSSGPAFGENESVTTTTVDSPGRLDLTWVHLVKPAEVPFDGGSFQNGFSWSLNGGGTFFGELSGAVAAWKREGASETSLKLDHIDAGAGLRIRVNQTQSHLQFRIPVGLYAPIWWKRTHSSLYLGLRARLGAELDATLKHIPLMAIHLNGGGTWVDSLASSDGVEIDSETVRPEADDWWEIHGGGGVSLLGLARGQVRYGSFHFGSGAIVTSMERIPIHQEGIHYMALEAELLLLEQTLALVAKTTRVLSGEANPKVLPLLAGKRMLSYARNDVSLGLSLRF